MGSFNRRQAIALVGAGATAACATPADKTSWRRPGSSSAFRHGVASGDPMTDSIVLWTRVTTTEVRQTVLWELATDPGFETIVASGNAVADAEADHTVKIIPGALQPGATYYYRFMTANETSPIGRTRTLPAGSLNRLGIALVSCSNYAFGHFNAYGAIADDDAIDIVLHTGDYIYEYGADGWGAETATALGRPHDPPHEIVTLADYRTRHAQYKTDAGSQSMHAAHPIVACWDDHESTNNPWKNGAQNHQPDTEGGWITRRDASLQAYYEWMPIREPDPGLTRADFWRTYSFGNLATLITLETRHTARDEQVDYGTYADSINTAQDRDAFMAEVIGDPSREMLSSEMNKALKSGLSASVSSGQPWRLIGNASPIARMLVPDVSKYGLDADKAPAGEVPGAGANLFWKGQWNLPFYTDTWDGYPAAREALYALCRETGTEDLLVLTGDSHSFWANTLFDGSGTPMGLELGTAGVSSPGDFVETGWDTETAAQLDLIFEDALDEVRWTDNLHQGYVRVVLTPEKANVDFVAVDTVLLEDRNVSILRSEVIERHNGTLEFRDDA